MLIPCPSCRKPVFVAGRAVKEGATRVDCRACGSGVEIDPSGQARLVTASVAPQALLSELPRLPEYQPDVPEPAAPAELPAPALPGGEWHDPDAASLRQGYAGDVVPAAMPGAIVEHVTRHLPAVGSLSESAPPTVPEAVVAPEPMRALEPVLVAAPEPASLAAPEPSELPALESVTAPQPAPAPAPLADDWAIRPPSAVLEPTLALAASDPVPQEWQVAAPAPVLARGAGDAWPQPLDLEPPEQLPPDRVELREAGLLPVAPAELGAPVNPVVTPALPAKAAPPAATGTPELASTENVGRGGRWGFALVAVVLLVATGAGYWLGQRPTTVTTAPATPAPVPPHAPAAAPTPASVPVPVPVQALTPAPVVAPTPTPAPPPAPPPTATPLPTGDPAVRSSYDRAGPRARSFYEQGNRLIGENKAAAAVQELRRAIQLEPKFGLAYRSMGVAYMMLAKEQSAIQAYQKFVLYEPEHRDTARVRELIAAYFKRAK